MIHRLFNAGLAAGLLTVALGATACGGAAGASVSGRDLYRSCESCHGPSAEGNAVIGAPALATLPTWYLTSQLERFQSGLRGKHPDDAEGLRMRAMSLQMMSKAEVESVAAYVSQLPAPVKAAPVLAGDASQGQPLYAVCVTCHGPKGEGNQQLNAPPLVQFEDWYIARQLRKFQTGVRGRQPEDGIGMLMATMAVTVPPDSVDHVAAYVHGLSK